jgi:hypothetical protein
MEKGKSLIYKRDIERRYILGLIAFALAASGCMSRLTPYGKPELSGNTPHPTAQPTQDIQQPIMDVPVLDSTSITPAENNSTQQPYSLTAVDTENSVITPIVLSEQQINDIIADYLETHQKILNLSLNNSFAYTNMACAVTCNEQNDAGTCQKIGLTVCLSHPTGSMPQNDCASTTIKSDLTDGSYLVNTGWLYNEYGQIKAKVTLKLELYIFSQGMRESFDPVQWSNISYFTPATGHPLRGFCKLISVDEIVNLSKTDK